MPGSASRADAAPHIHCSPESELLAAEKLPQEAEAGMNVLPSLARSKMHLPSCGPRGASQTACQTGDRLMRAQCDHSGGQTVRHL